MLMVVWQLDLHVPIQSVLQLHATQTRCILRYTMTTLTQRYSNLSTKIHAQIYPKQKVHIIECVQSMCIVWILLEICYIFHKLALVPSLYRMCRQKLKYIHVYCFNCSNVQICQKSQVRIFKENLQLHIIQNRHLKCFGKTDRSTNGRTENPVPRTSLPACLVGL